MEHKTEHKLDYQWTKRFMIAWGIMALLMWKPGPYDVDTDTRIMIVDMLIYGFFLGMGLVPVWIASMLRYNWLPDGRQKQFMYSLKNWLGILIIVLVAGCWFKLFMWNSLTWSCDMYMQNCEGILGYIIRIRGY